MFAPITTVQDTLSGYGAVNSITVQARSQTALNAAEAEVTHDPRAAPPDHRHLRTGVLVINQGSLLTASSSSSSVFTTLLGEVAAISLLVGGIGVMNIMLVASPSAPARSASARPSARGAADILTQFLTEARARVGVRRPAGRGLGLLGSQFEIAGVHPVIATYSIFLAFGAAVLTGLFFGTYPAAARRVCGPSRRCASSEAQRATGEPLMPEHQAPDTQDLALEEAPPVRVEEHWEDEPELPPRPRRRLMTPLTGSLLGVLLLALGFIGGVLVQKGQEGSSSPAAGAGGFASRLAALKTGARTAGAPGTAGAKAQRAPSGRHGQTRRPAK